MQSIFETSQIKAATPQLSNNLRQWVATCLIDGYSSKAIGDKLALYIDGSFSAHDEVKKIQNDPVMLANSTLLKKHKKLLSLFDALSTQFKHSKFASEVPVEINISPASFFDNYYFANRPVVVRGLMKNWPAIDQWSPSLFIKRFGDQMVEVSADRSSDPKFEDRFPLHRKEMRMCEFIDLIQTDIGNDVYLVAKNNLLEKPEFADLLTEIGHPAGFLRIDHASNQPRIWIGGSGTVTPLHHDSTNIFFGQVYGRKLVRLIPPFEINNLYNDRACFSAVDIDNVDFSAFPRMREVTILEVIVEPGDFLFFPIGWWHAVRSLELSISLSYQNFAVPKGVTIWNH